LSESNALHLSDKSVFVMSQGLSGLVPCLSLEDHIYQADDFISLNSMASLSTTEPVSLDRRSLRSCGNYSMESDMDEKGFMDVKVIPAAFHRSNSKQVLNWFWH
jgi:hypothetical protein